MRYNEIKSISEKIGDSFYIFKEEELINNIFEFKKSFYDFYSNINIGYSVKTNYIPYACKVAYKQGAYIEVVSDMELQIVINAEIPSQNIIYNGPIKDNKSLEYCLLKGIKINVDNLEEMLDISEIANKFPDYVFKIGIRINIPLNDGFESRFGFDIETENFKKALSVLDTTKNIEINGIHTHSTRPDKSVDCYLKKLDYLVHVYQKYFFNSPIEYIDLGGGFYGKMDENIKSQFPNENIVSFEEYGKALGERMKEHFPEEKMELILEPGLAMSVNTMDFVCKVVNLREIQGKNITTTTGSFHNIKPSGHKKNLTVEHLSLFPKMNLTSDIVGYTCLENDIMYQNYPFKTYPKDFFIFKNVGAYTLVFKPIFIKLTPAIITLKNENYKIIKEVDNFENMFKSYKF